MSFLFISLMLRMKKIVVATAIQTRLMSSDGSIVPNMSPLARKTMWVRGKTNCAKTCIEIGRVVIGKKVPLSRNIGVMYRNPG